MARATEGCHVRPTAVQAYSVRIQMVVQTIVHVMCEKKHRHSKLRKLLPAKSCGIVCFEYPADVVARSVEERLVPEVAQRERVQQGLPQIFMAFPSHGIFMAFL